MRGDEMRGRSRRGRGEGEEGEEGEEGLEYSGVYTVEFFFYLDWFLYKKRLFLQLSRVRWCLLYCCWYIKWWLVVVRWNTIGEESVNLHTHRSVSNIIVELLRLNEYILNSTNDNIWLKVIRKENTTLANMATPQNIKYKNKERHYIQLLFNKLKTEARWFIIYLTSYWKVIIRKPRTYMRTIHSVAPHFLRNLLSVYFPNFPIHTSQTYFVFISIYIYIVCFSFLY